MVVLRIITEVSVLVEKSRFYPKAGLIETLATSLVWLFPASVVEILVSQSGNVYRKGEG